jgi:hypothetical protein
MKAEDAAQLADIERRFNRLMERHNEDAPWLNETECRRILTELQEWMKGAADES